VPSGLSRNRPACPRDEEIAGLKAQVAELEARVASAVPAESSPTTGMAGVCVDAEGASAHIGLREPPVIEHIALASYGVRPAFIAATEISLPRRSTSKIILCASEAG
jgi:hypothetical protein